MNVANNVTRLGSIAQPQWTILFPLAPLFLGSLYPTLSDESALLGKMSYHKQGKGRSHWADLNQKPVDFRIKYILETKICNYRQTILPLLTLYRLSRTEQGRWLRSPHVLASRQGHPLQPRWEAPKLLCGVDWTSHMDRHVPWSPAKTGEDFFMPGHELEHENKCVTVMCSSLMIKESILSCGRYIVVLSGGVFIVMNNLLFRLKTHYQITVGMKF